MTLQSDERASTPPVRHCSSLAPSGVRGSAAAPRFRFGRARRGTGVFGAFAGDVPRPPSPRRRRLVPRGARDVARARARGADRPRAGVRVHPPRVRHLGRGLVPRRVPRGGRPLPPPPHVRLQRPVRRPPPGVRRAADPRGRPRRRRRARAAAVREARPRARDPRASPRRRPPNATTTTRRRSSRAIERAARGGVRRTRRPRRTTPPRSS